jgi:hypothetical protein
MRCTTQLSSLWRPGNVIYRYRCMCMCNGHVHGHVHVHVHVPVLYNMYMHMYMHMDLYVPWARSLANGIGSMGSTASCTVLFVRLHRGAIHRTQASKLNF